MRLRHWSACALLCGLLAGGLASVLQAAPPAAPGDSSKSQDPLKQWAELTAERDKLGEKFKTMFEKFKAADDQTKQAMIPELQKLQETYMTQIQPQIVKLAPVVYEKDPKNAEAASIVLAIAYEENDYAKVLKLAEPILKSPKPDPVTLNIAGIAYFATGDFARAQELLAQAKTAEPRMYAQLGARFAEAIPDYIKFWEREQAIRAKEAKANDLPRVLMKTSRGDIEIELFENEAPNAVANFISLVEKGFYNGTAFHRVLPNFMAQGGDPNSSNDDPSDDGMGGPGYNIACECYQENARKHFQGSLSMAHAGKDSGGSQFFITHLPTPHLNANPAEQTGHTVFGRVIKGMDVALALKKGDKIVSVKVIRKRDHKYVPETAPEKKRETAPPKFRFDKRPAKKAPQNDE